MRVLQAKNRGMANHTENILGFSSVIIDVLLGLRWVPQLGLTMFTVCKVTGKVTCRRVSYPMSLSFAIVLVRVLGAGHESSLPDHSRSLFICVIIVAVSTTTASSFSMCCRRSSVFVLRLLTMCPRATLTAIVGDRPCEPASLTTLAVGACCDPGCGYLVASWRHRAESRPPPGLQADCAFPWLADTVASILL
jgi:hypothetical protein